MELQNVNGGAAPAGPILNANSRELTISGAGIGRSGPYALATGPAAVRRLHLLHKIYAPAGRRVLLEAGLKEGMRVADFGCGVGMVSRMLAEIVGPAGEVVGIDVNKAQLEEAANWCAESGLRNCSFVAASAESTGLPRNSFDLVYCRFLLLHLPDPMSCLREMRDILKPGGILVVEDGDLRSAGSIPPSAQDEFANLFSRFEPLRGLNYSISNDLYHLVREAGFGQLRVDIHQPALLEEEERYFLQWSVAEAGEAFVNAGLTSYEELELTLMEMKQASVDPGVLILAPRMFIVSATKPAR
jgi:ubiquinone/menaquinone biosynthesis C-methylase UbiE